MSSSQTAVETYKSPKQLSETLAKDHGLAMSPDYIRAIRQECESKKNGVFVNGDARASDLIDYLKSNPGFRRSSVRKPRS